MNTTYKLVKNARTGKLSVASELAKGHKNSSSKVLSIALLTSLSFVTTGFAEDHVVSGFFQSAELIQDTNGNYIGHTDINNHKTDTYYFSPGEHTVKLGNISIEKRDPKRIHDFISTQDLFNLGALEFFDVTDADKETPLTSMPTYLMPNYKATKKKVTWITEDGTQREIDVWDVYNPANVNEILSFDDGYVVVEQPDMPYYDFTFAVIEDGTMKFDEQGTTKELEFDQIKNSSLFIADSTRSGESAKIEIGKVNEIDLKVDFGLGLALKTDPKFSKKEGVFKPSHKFAGTIYNNNLIFTADDGTVYNGYFTITDQASLNAYNEAIIAAIKKNLILESQYLSNFDMAFVETTDDDAEYTYTYDYKPEEMSGDKFHFPDEIIEESQFNSIFQAKGSDASIEIGSNANLQAIGGNIVYALNNSKVTDNSDTVLLYNMGNALVDDAQYTNNGRIVFGYDSKDGSWDANKKIEKSRIDVVKGKDGEYVNNGEIFVGSGNTALSISKEGSFVNEGTVYIASTDGKMNDFANGFSIVGDGNWANNGDIYVGKGKDDSGALVNRETLSTNDVTGDFEVKKMNNVVGIIVDKKNNNINVQNDGRIYLGDELTHATSNEKVTKDAAGFNVEYTYGKDDPRVTDISVVNNGEIFVGGQHSVGMRFYGKLGEENGAKFIGNGVGGTITVFGQNGVGLASIGEAIAYNKGTIIVGESSSTAGSLTTKYRNYGARAENATIIFDAGSEIKLQGDYAVGVHARSGGVIILGDQVRVESDSKSKNLVYYWISGHNIEGGETTSSRVDFGGGSVDITLNNENSVLFRVDQGASFDSTGATVGDYKFTISGKNSTGLYLADNGTTALTGSQITLNVDGENATGIYVTTGTGADGNIVIGENTKITVTGKEATAMVIDGKNYDVDGKDLGTYNNQTKAISEAKLNSNNINLTNSAYGYNIINQGNLEHKGTIDFTGVGSDGKAVGIRIDGGYLNNTEDAIVEVNGVGVDIYQTTGNFSKVGNLGSITAKDGIAAVRLNKNVDLTVSGNKDNGIILGQKNADAILVRAGSKLTTDNAQLKVDGNGSGIHFMNTDDTETGEFRLSGSGVITVSGSKGFGIKVEGQNSAGESVQAVSDFLSDNSSNLVINVEDKGGNGIYVNTKGKVHSGASVNIKSDEGESAFVVVGDTKVISQSGRLTTNSNKAVVDLTGLGNTNEAVDFTNTGSILVKDSVSNGIALDASIDKEIHFVNGKSGETKGEITGTVLLGDNNNTVTLYGGSKADVITSGNGENTFTLMDVKKEQSGEIFNKITTGMSANDSLELRASAEGKSSYYALTDDKSSNITGFEHLKIGKNSIFELDHSDISLNEDADQSGIHIEEGGMLFVNQSGAADDYTFDHKLNGQGTLKTDINGKAFTFNPIQADYSKANFSGTLWLENATYNLKDQDTVALTNATLKVGNNSKVTVEKGTNEQNIGGLSFDGGHLSFLDVLPNLSSKNTLTDGSIHTKVLDYNNAKGTISVNVGADIDNIPPTNIASNLNTIPLTELDDGDVFAQLIKADSVQGDYNGNLVLELHDKNGNNVTDIADLDSSIIQNSVDVADATFGYKLKASEDGVSVTYALEKINLKGTGDNALILFADSDPNKPIDSLDLNAKVTGSGDLAIDTNSEYLSLSNSNNDYTGATYVRNGTLKLQGDHVLGDTCLLSVSQNGRVDFTSTSGGSVSQTVGLVETYQGSLVNLGLAGELTIKGSDTNGNTTSTIHGNIEGGSQSKLILESGVTEIYSKNTNMFSDVDLKNSSYLHLFNAKSAGMGGFINFLDSTTTLEISNNDLGDIEFNKALIGDGSLKITEYNVLGNANETHVALTADNSNYTGDIYIGKMGDTKQSKLTVYEAKNLGNDANNILVEGKGVLDFNYSPANPNETDIWVVDNSITGSGSVEKNGYGTIQLTQSAAEYTGSTFVNSGMLIAGTDTNRVNMKTTYMSIANGASFSGFGSILGSVNNSGNFYVGSIDKSINDVPVLYRVNGDFTNSATGTIFLNKKESLASGEKASGNIGNALYIGGNFYANGGAIVLNTVLNDGFGNTKTDSLVVNRNVYSNGTPTKLYVQYAGGAGAYTQPDAIKVVDVGGYSANNAFTLGAPVNIGVYEYTLHKGMRDNSWYLDTYDRAYPVYVNPELEVNGKRNVNSMIGGYIANKSTAFEMFSLSLHDRLGNPNYANGLKDGDMNGSAWGRIVTTHRKYQVADRGLSVSGDYYIAQVGADLLQVSASNDAIMRFGVMGAYGSSDFKSRSLTTGTEATAKIDQAMSIGVYGTWYNPNGLYVDAWLQYSHFRNEVSLKHQSYTKYNSNMLSGSIELGYRFNIADFGGGHSLVLMPSAQIIYSHLTTKGYEDPTSGLYTKKGKQNNLHTRLGIRLSYQTVSKNGNTFSPFAEVNWLHDSSRAGSVFNESYHFNSNQAKSRYELKLGVEGELSSRWSMWGNVSYQFGKQKTSGYKATFGVKYTW